MVIYSTALSVIFTDFLPFTKSKLVNLLETVHSTASPQLFLPLPSHSMLQLHNSPHTSVWPTVSHLSILAPHVLSAYDVIPFHSFTSYVY